jgi:hypothetical protein
MAGMATAIGLVLNSDRDIKPDHASLQRQPGIGRCRARVIAVAHADPGDTIDLGLGDGGFGRLVQHQMPHAIVAIDQRGGGVVTGKPDVGSLVDAARPDAPDILRQSENTVSVGAADVGLDHQPGNDRRVRGRNAGGDEGLGGKLS